MSRFHWTLSATAERLSTHQDERFAEVFTRGSLRLGLYAPRGSDPQQPHNQDEVYVVQAGSGWFRNGDDWHPFEPGDILFVPAGTPHRFEDFSDDLNVWVIFYGPVGGERAG